MAAGVSRQAVIYQQSGQRGSQHTVLGRASAGGDGGGDGVVNPDSEWLVGQEVQDPVLQSGSQSKQGELLPQSVG